MTINRSQFTVKQIDWNTPDAEDARQIRFEVFVNEQKVPAELELDEIDATAVHVLAYDEQGQPCGTGRMFPFPDESEMAKIGRMAVLKQARNTGCGAALLTKLIDIARANGYKGAVLSAQVHAVPFYEKFGFVADPLVYDDAGIPHQTMRLIFSNQ